MAQRRARRHGQCVSPAPPPQVVTLDGPADFWRAHAVEIEVGRALGRGARRFVVDLTAAVGIDSAMLRSLILAQKDVHRRDGRVVFHCGETGARRLLHLTGLDTVMDVVSTRDEAVSRLSR